LTVDVACHQQYGFAFGSPILGGEIVKTLLGQFVVCALGVLTIGVFAGRAQILNEIKFTMSQPFTVANTTLAAGSYTIRPVSGTDQMVVEISGASGKPSVMVEGDSVQPDAAQGGSHLVFNKYKNVLALSQVFPGGGNQGYQFVPGNPEKLAAKTEKPTKQTVASSAK
jgi:hypothetical protein